MWTDVVNFFLNTHQSSYKVFGLLKKYLKFSHSDETAFLIDF